MTELNTTLIMARRFIGSAEDEDKRTERIHRAITSIELAFDVEMHDASMMRPSPFPVWVPLVYQARYTLSNDGTSPIFEAIRELRGMLNTDARDNVIDMTNDNETTTKPILYLSKHVTPQTNRYNAAYRIYDRFGKQAGDRVLGAGDDWEREVSKHVEIRYNNSYQSSWGDDYDHRATPGVGHNLGGVPDHSANGVGTDVAGEVPRPSPAARHLVSAQGSHRAAPAASALAKLVRFFGGKA